MTSLTHENKKTTKNHKKKKIAKQINEAKGRGFCAGSERKRQKQLHKSQGLEMNGGSGSGLVRRERKKREKVKEKNENRENLVVSDYRKRHCFFFLRLSFYFQSKSGFYLLLFIFLCVIFFLHI